MTRLNLKNYIDLWKAWIWYKILMKAPCRYGTHVANRTIRRDNLAHLECTITLRDIRKPDGYSREELYQMLGLIRLHEELQNWKVPEPIKCEYCEHTAPELEDKCPICGCTEHHRGLVSRYRQAVGEECGFTRNPAFASTGSLQDG